MDYVSSTTVSTSPPTNNPRETCQLRRPSRSRLLYPPPPPTQSPPSSSPPRLGPAKPFSLQTRRLQLRNAGFRAAQLPGRKISDHLATTWRSLSGSSERETDKENILRSPIYDDSSRENSLRRKVNVLQEINNSSSRRHISPRPSVTALFADTPPREHSPDSLFSPLPRKSGPRLDPPISFDGSDDSDFDSAMKTREYSLSGNSPLGHSPSIIRRKRRNNRRQQADYETTKYIEHLEAQLVASQTELDSRETSPIKPQIAKLRSLNAEIRALKQEIADWQDKFESRVREEIGSRSETECKLKAKISALEEKIEADRRRMKELVYENETQAQKLRNATALSSTNRSLERRVDVLTELLAVSPTRMDAARSPTRTEVLSPIKGAAPRIRPRSMMPCIPCSPRAVNDAGLQPLTLDAKTSDDVPCLSVQVAENNSRSNEESTPDRATPSTRPESMLTDSLSAESSSLSSMSKSQRSSMLSQSSSISTWSLPFPFSPDFRGRTQNRHKSMRRFPSGSCNLKPLILPSATATMSDCPPSATFDHMLSPRHESQSSYDPTAAFLDEQEYDVSWDDKNICTETQQNSLDALEGRTCYYGSFEEAISRKRKPKRLNLSPSPHRGLDLRSDGCLSGRSLHDIILEEDDEEELNNSPQPDHDITAHESPEAGHGQSLQQNVLAHEIGEDYTKTPSRSSLKRLKNKRSVKDRTQKSKGNESKSLVCSPIAGAACGEAVDILTRYTSWFRELQRRPSELARRIIANAWHSNWRRLGKLSWWVLGLFFGPQIRDGWCTHSSTAEADNYDWHRYSMATFHLRHGSDVINDEPATDLALLSETSNRLSGQAWCDVSRIQDDRADPPDKEQSNRRPSCGHSLYLWAKFSFAIIVAIGIAVKNGPGSLLEDCPDAPYAVIAHDPDRPEEKSSLDRPMDPRRSWKSDASDVEDFVDSEMSGSAAFAEDDAPQSIVWTPNLPINDFPHD